MERYLQQERKSVSATGLVLRRLSGDELTPRMWDAFYRFYRNTTGMRCVCIPKRWSHGMLPCMHMAAGMDLTSVVHAADAKWGQAYLTRDFFHRLGETMVRHQRACLLGWRSLPPRISSCYSTPMRRATAWCSPLRLMRMGRPWLAR